MNLKACTCITNTRQLPVYSQAVNLEPYFKFIIFFQSYNCPPKYTSNFKLENQLIIKNP